MMRKHLTDGEVRAALDGELGTEQLRHLETCADCQVRQRQLQVEQGQMARRLAFLAPADEPVPVHQKVWNRFAQQIQMKKESSMFKKWFAFPAIRVGTAALLILALVLAFRSEEHTSELQSPYVI